MKISVEGFKSIKSLKGFKIDPINIMAGINSSGKTSLSQVLLLLKQTLETDTSEPLQLGGPYVYADSLKDLLYGKTVRTKLVIELEFDVKDLIGDSRWKHYLREDDVKKITLLLEMKANASIHVVNAKIDLMGESNAGFVQCQWSASSNTATMKASDGVLVGLIDEREKIQIEDGVFELRSFLPTYISGKDSKSGLNRLISIDVFKDMREFLRNYFAKIYYIAPIRIKPALAQSYEITPKWNVVEPDGSNTRYILSEKKDMRLSDGTKLGVAVNQWIKKLGLAQGIDAQKDSKSLYRSYMKNGQGLTIDLCHMGFGISQILPIIVQGLLLPPGGLLIVEDPEVHMHPSVQAGLVDFFLMLSEQGKRVLIETHSDHVVTRLRRRVAEGYKPEHVNLTFVQNTPSGSLYTKIGLTGQGAFSDTLPEGFLDSQDSDFRAIIKASAR